MIAEIDGKISSTGSKLSERLEDQLTGNIFGTLRYIDFQAALIPFLESSYSLTKDGKRVPLNFCNAQIKEEIQFWPWIVEAEPDVLIQLTENSNQGVIILIEAKYYSPLSSDDKPDNATKQEETVDSGPIDTYRYEDSLQLESHNQLIRQMRGMKEMYPGLRRVQIFLTTDQVYPREILFRVRQRADAEGLKDTELYWLSWHDLPTILQEILEKGNKWLSKREEIIVFDLLRLCEKKGFARFSRLEVPNRAAPGGFRLVVGTPLKRAPMPVAIRLPMVPKAIPSPIL